jgi:hypothetical protein
MLRLHIWRRGGWYCEYNTPVLFHVGGNDALIFGQTGEMVLKIG